MDERWGRREWKAEREKQKQNARQAIWRSRILIFLSSGREFFKGNGKKHFQKNLKQNLTDDLSAALFTFDE